MLKKVAKFMLLRRNYFEEFLTNYFFKKFIKNKKNSNIKKQKHSRIYVYVYILIYKVMRDLVRIEDQSWESIACS